MVDYYLREELNGKKNWNFYRENRLQLTAVYCPDGGLKGMYPAPHIHEHLATAY